MIEKNGKSPSQSRKMFKNLQYLFDNSFNNNQIHYNYYYDSFCSLKLFHSRRWNLVSMFSQRAEQIECVNEIKKERIQVQTVLHLGQMTFSENF